MKPCTRCHRPHTGRKVHCYRCVGVLRSVARYHKQREFWGPCLAVAGEYVLRAMKDRRLS
jgi:hypothetical protein